MIYGFSIKTGGAANTVTFTDTDPATPILFHSEIVRSPTISTWFNQQDPRVLSPPSGSQSFTYTSGQRGPSWAICHISNESYGQSSAAIADNWIGCSQSPGYVQPDRGTTPSSGSVGYSEIGKPVADGNGGWITRDFSTYTTTTGIIPPANSTIIWNWEPSSNVGTSCMDEISVGIAKCAVNPPVVIKNYDRSYTMSYKPIPYTDNNLGTIAFTSHDRGFSQTPYGAPACKINFYFFWV